MVWLEFFKLHLEKWLLAEGKRLDYKQIRPVYSILLLKANKSDIKVQYLMLMIFQEFFVKCRGSKVAHKPPREMVEGD